MVCTAYVDVIGCTVSVDVIVGTVSVDVIVGTVSVDVIVGTVSVDVIVGAVSVDRSSRRKVTLNERTDAVWLGSLCHYGLCGRNILCGLYRPNSLCGLCGREATLNEGTDVARISLDP